jgi:integrase
MTFLNGRMIGTGCNNRLVNIVSLVHCLIMEKIRGLYEKVKGSGSWWIRYADSNGNKRREKAGRRSDAITLLAKRKTEKLQQKKLPENSNLSTLFSELLDDALEHSKAENGQRSTHELKLKIERIRSEWGSRKVKDITKKEIVSWLQSEMAKRDWTVATMNRWQACFSLVFRVAVDNEKIAINPASRIRRKAENNQSVRYLTLEEEGRIQAVLATRCPSYLPAFIISLHTGLRASEQWNLRWSDIDLERKSLTVRKQKTGKGERHIRLNNTAVAAFKSIRKGADLASVPFLNSKGTPMTTHRDWFDPAVLEAKVPNYTWHKNRHTFASRLAMASVDIRTIAQLMGHGTIQMSMRYAHLSPDHNQAAVDRLEEYKIKGTPKRTPVQSKKVA